MGFGSYGFWQSYISLVLYKFSLEGILNLLLTKVVEFIWLMTSN